MKEVTSFEQTSASSSTGLRFCWLRETAPGHLEFDGGIRIARCDLLQALFGIHPAQKRTPAEPPVSLGEILAALSTAAPMDEFPQWARRRLANILGPLALKEQRHAAAANAAILMDVAHRILSVLPAQGDVEVHLPFLSRRGWTDRFEILSGTEFVLHQGRVIPSQLLSPQQSAEYTAQLVALSSLNPASEVGVTFTHTQSVAAGLQQALIPVQAVAADGPRGTAHDTEVHLSLPSFASRAWHSAPLETSGSYFPVHSAVSIAIQLSLRRWLAWHWLSDLDHYEDKLGAFTVLAYLCSQPFPGRRRTDFTYDTLSTDWMSFAFRCARRPLRQLLKTIHAALIGAGKAELAEAYRPDRAKAILQRIKKERRSIRSVVATDGDIVNHILKFGLQLQGKGDALTAAREAVSFMDGLHVRLRRLFREQDLTWMAEMLVIEATNALYVALGGAPAVRTECRATPVRTVSLGFAVPLFATCRQLNASS